MQNADINLATSSDVTEIHVNLQFDPQKIDILRILPDYKNREESIEFDIKYGEISYSHTNMIYTPWYEIKVFNILFNSKNNIDAVDFVFGSGSYAISQGGKRVNLTGNVVIPFATVTECDPDIIPPSVSLIRPIPSESGVSLDSLFVFEIKDIGKGVDLDSISIVIDDEPYTMATPGVAFSGEFLVVQPKTWLPVASEVEVKVSVADLQIFGWANKAEKTFFVNTASHVVLDEKLNPMELKQRSREIRQHRWSPEECQLLTSIQSFIAESNQSMIQAVADKLECDLVLSFEDDYDASAMHGSAGFFLTQDPNKLSIFALLWWLLFLVTLILKLHYFSCYKKQKKILETPNLTH